MKQLHFFSRRHQVNWALLVWIILAKLTMYWIFIYPTGSAMFGPFLKGDDYDEYIGPTDNFFDHGTYSLTPDSEPYAGRLPGFVFPYFIFRIFFNRDLAPQYLGVFIFLMAVISQYMIINSFRKFIPRGASILLFLALVFVPYFWPWEWKIHPNSLSVSCMLLGLYSFSNIIQYFSLKSIFWCGFWLTWVFFLRGFTLPYIFITGSLIFYIKRKSGINQKLILVYLVYFSSFLIAECTWVGRNFISLNKFIPLQTTFVPGKTGVESDYGRTSATKPSMQELRKLISCWGGDNFWYFKNSDLAWFMGIDSGAAAEKIFPSVVFNSGISVVQLHHLRDWVVLSYDSTLPMRLNEKLDSIIVAESRRMSSQFKAHNKLYFWLVSPFKRIRNFLIRNVTQDWPGESFTNNSLVEKALKLGSLLFYYTFLTCGIAMSFFRRSWNNNLKRWMGGCFIALILLFGLVINAAHFNYFFTGYVCTILFSLLFFSKNKFIHSYY